MCCSACGSVMLISLRTCPSLSELTRLFIILSQSVKQRPKSTTFNIHCYHIASKLLLSKNVIEIHAGNSLLSGNFSAPIGRPFFAHIIRQANLGQSYFIKIKLG